MKRRIFYILLIVLIAGAIFYAPYFLLRSDPPERSEVVVLFIGSEFSTRKLEAFKLIIDGYARYLIIPAYGRVSDAGLFPQRSDQINIKPDRLTIRNLTKSGRYPRYYEDTHVEVLEAKRMMDKAGLKSALFVSSPYHMRRIGIIADRVLGKDNYKIRYIPTRFEESDRLFWFFKKRDIKLVSGEYTKIIWFLLYHPFAPDNPDKARP